METIQLLLLTTDQIALFRQLQLRGRISARLRRSESEYVIPYPVPG